MKKKILFVGNDINTFGSSRSALNLADELRKKNLDIVFLLPLPKIGKLINELKRRNIRYKRFIYFSWVYKIDKNSVLKKITKLFLTYINLPFMYCWVKKEKVDIIHSVNSAVFVGALIAKKLNIKHVWHIRELMEEDHDLTFYNKEYAYNLLNEADKLICISNVVYDKYKNYLNNDKLKLIYNGLPLNEYNNDNIRNKKDFNILIAGSISHTKGQLDAIKAIELLVNKNFKNIKLFIAGRGYYESYLKKYVKENNLDKYVEFLGFIDDLSDIRKNMNIALVCSRKEAFGRVTIESMMSKNLVIGANSGGTIEIVQDGKNGFLYKEGNYKDLAKKIEYSITNWNTCKKIIEYAYDYSIKNYSIIKCANSVYEVYKEV